MIKDYIEQLNECLPTVSEIQENFERTIGKKLTTEEAEEYQYRMRILYEKKSDFKNLIEDLVLNTNISFISVGSINFAFDIKEIEEDIISFAEYRDGVIEICYDNNGKVYVLDNNTEEVGVFTNDYTIFLQFLVFYQRIYNNKIFRSKSPSDIEQKTLLLLTEKGLAKKIAGELIEELI